MRAERCSAISRFSLPLCPVGAKFPSFPARHSAPSNGKKCITSDALFADLLLSPPSLRDTSPHISVSLNFFEKKFNECLRKDYTGLLPSARRDAADCRFLSSLAALPLVSPCFRFYKGKKSITSDAFLRMDFSVFNLPYRKRTFLSPPSLRDTSPYHKGRHG